MKFLVLSIAMSLLAVSSAIANEQAPLSLVGICQYSRSDQKLKLVVNTEELAWFRQAPAKLLLGDEVYRDGFMISKAENGLYPVTVRGALSLRSPNGGLIMDVLEGTSEDTRLVLEHTRIETDGSGTARGRKTRLKPLVCELSPQLISAL